MRKCFNPATWPSRLVARYLLAVFLLCFAVANYILWANSAAWDNSNTHTYAPLTFGNKHPIKKLMIDARARHDALLKKQSHDIFDASARYRARRGRHPPPGFDEWVKAAVKSDAVIVEDYFDRIYKDLTPFWALDPETIRMRANGWYHSVKVRDGKATAEGNVEGLVRWLRLWTELVGEFASHLPDVDMPINYMDEPRLLVPFDDIAKLVEEAQSRRTIVPIDNVTTTYKGLADVDAAAHEPYNPVWLNVDSNYWNLAQLTCGPDSPARNTEQLHDLVTAPVEYPTDWAPEYASKGYIKNWTAAMDPCLQPHLRYLHGTFVEPLSQSTAQELIPMFGGSKLPMNNEILIPGAMYLTENEFYSGGEDHGPAWPLKKDGIVWRGDANGGRSKPSQWQHFQRHRLIEMLNGTVVSNIEHNGTEAQTFRLPSADLYRSTRRTFKQLGDWLTGFSNCGFVHLLCSPGECAHLDPYYSELEPMPMSEQYQFKFLPDADGNSFSARFRGFMRSTSTPLKATVYAEWHDDRLIPWLHFVPLDNTFQDLYSVLEYFSDAGGPGDAAARYIAERGQEWSEKVLRRADMRLYTWRLLLEWARVCDDNRDTMGFIKDLVEET
ncbi:hypothetical protein G7046_g6715 [Stylonectria norvegica]|nr:hypothetical protein G7046_g6715 [Stylonectria norvegica]